MMLLSVLKQRSLPSVVPGGSASLTLLPTTPAANHTNQHQQQRVARLHSSSQSQSQRCHRQLQLTAGRSHQSQPHQRRFHTHSHSSTADSAARSRMLLIGTTTATASALALAYSQVYAEPAYAASPSSQLPDTLPTAPSSQQQYQYGAPSAASPASPYGAIPALPEDEEDITPALSAASKRTYRPKLKNPGKYDHFHRDSQNILGLQIFPGARIQMASQLFAGTDEERATGNFEKQVTILPVMSFGGQEGSSGMLNVITQLGQQHELRAMIDQHFNLTGKWKRTAVDRHWALKAEFQIAPQQNGIVFAGDYKGKDWTSTLSATNGQEYNLQYTQQLTPALSAGVELTHALLQATFLGAQAKYHRDYTKETVACSYKIGQVHTSYAKEVTPNLALATEFRYNTMNKESMWQVGMLHRRPGSFTYQAALQSNKTVAAYLEQPIAPGIAFQVSGAIAHDGSNESTFGFGLQIG